MSAEFNNSRPEPENNSSRHHYIPKFYIKGFTNDNNKLYVFDKKKNRILKNEKSPKSIFFEHERNTIDLGAKGKSSILEDMFYSHIDSEFSKTIQYFQNEKLNLIDFNYENIAQLELFLITLFWRIPKTDYAFEDLIQRSKISKNGISNIDVKNDPVYKKMERSKMFYHHIKEMSKANTKAKKWVNIHKTNDAKYVIGDYPILFRKTPNKFNDFNKLDYLIALSSDRLYSSTSSKFENVTFKNSFIYNAAVIEQSTRYVASSDLTVLEKSIELYHNFKETGIIYLMPERVFET